MRKIFIASIFIFTICAFTFGQNPNCPEINVTGPSSVVKPGETMTFTVNVSDIDLDNIEYVWSVDKGTIIEGQGGPVIVVSTEGLNDTTITANVEIKNMPNSCANTKSESGIVAIGCGLPIIIDEYGKISRKEEKERLRVIIENLREYKDSAALFMIYYTEKTTRQNLEKRAREIYNFLIVENKIPKERVGFIFVGEMDSERTRIYLPSIESGLGNYDLDEGLKGLKFPVKK